MAAPVAQAAQTATVISRSNPGPPTYAPAVVPPGRYASLRRRPGPGDHAGDPGRPEIRGRRRRDRRYRYNKTEGALSFASGPFAGSYARMFNARTIGMSDRGSTRLYIRCTRPN